jgi:hypothetical protein
MISKTLKIDLLASGAGEYLTTLYDSNGLDVPDEIANIIVGVCKSFVENEFIYALMDDAFNGGYLEIKRGAEQVL